MYKNKFIELDKNSLKYPKAKIDYFINKNMLLTNKTDIYGFLDSILNYTNNDEFMIAAFNDLLTKLFIKIDLKHLKHDYLHQILMPHFAYMESYFINNMAVDLINEYNLGDIFLDLMDISSISDLYNGPEPLFPPYIELEDGTNFQDVYYKELIKYLIKYSDEKFSILAISSPEFDSFLELHYKIRPNELVHLYDPYEIEYYLADTKCPISNEEYFKLISLFTLAAFIDNKSVSSMFVVMKTDDIGLLNNNKLGEYALIAVNSTEYNDYASSKSLSNYAYSYNNDLYYRLLYLIS